MDWRISDDRSGPEGRLYNMFVVDDGVDGRESVQGSLTPQNTFVGGNFWAWRRQTFFRSFLCNGGSAITHLQEDNSWALRSRRRT